MDVNNLKDCVVDPGDIDIDGKIGKKIRELRLIHGMSQDDLGKKVGVTFQQIQKYEKGTNRVLVSRLYSIAKALSSDIPYFFSDIPNPNNTATRDAQATPYTCDSDTGTSGGSTSEYPSALHEKQDSFEYNHSEGDAESKEILVLVREYQKIKNKKSRSAVYSLIKSLSSSQD